MTNAFDPYHKWLGIPPADQPPNRYRLLGIPPFENDPDVITAAANQRVLHLRTYQLGRQSALSEKLLSEVVAAQILLLSPEKKAKYDEYLRSALQAGLARDTSSSHEKRQWKRWAAAIAIAVVTCIVLLFWGLPSSNDLNDGEALQTKLVGETIASSTKTEIVNLHANPALIATPTPPIDDEKSVPVENQSTVAKASSEPDLMVEEEPDWPFSEAEARRRQDEAARSSNRPVEFTNSIEVDNPSAAMSAAKKTIDSSLVRGEGRSNVLLSESEPQPETETGSKYIKRAGWLSCGVDAARMSAASLSLLYDQFTPPGATAEASGKHLFELHSKGIRTIHRHSVKFYSGEEITINCLQAWDAYRTEFGKHKEDFFGDGLTPSGKVEGMAGGTLSQADNTCFLGCYDDGIRNGAFYVWHKGTIPALQCEYKRNGREGLSCYFHTIKKEGEDALACLFIVEYQNGAIERVHRFSSDGCKVLASYESVAAIKADSEASRQWEHVDCVDNNFAAAERALKKEADKIVSALKRSRLSVLNKAKREAISNRAKQRAAENARFIHEWKKKAGW